MGRGRRRRRRQLTGGILALDLSSTVGWAYGLPGRGPALDFGSWALARTSNDTMGSRFASFDNELRAALKRFRPQHLCLEAPLPPQAQTNATSCRIAYGLDAIARGNAYRFSCAVHAIDTRSARAEVVPKPPRGMFRDDKVSKDTIIAWAKSQGRAVTNDHQADALVILEYYRHRLA